MFSERRMMMLVRQGELAARSQMLREQLAQDSMALERPLAIADQLRGGAHWLISRPWWIAAAVALPIVLRPRRAAAWGVKLWWGWRLWRKAQPFLAHIGRR
ncbi:YqjK family protein [Ramlibacter sp. WS9]|uniref:YqjK family protein n=1 Tax=Ramlibacter sp. WS9 TaxID=1882741 RepID=UPI001142C3A7|nr:YqjK family protein [Ramlibacter sp. WS9]ROZ71246.1 hypothetical protein EEB15_21615 [Ramlibacter sp. WS9]